MIERKDRPSDPRLEGFDRFVKRSMSEWRIPGLEVGIVADRRMVYARGYGLRDLRRRLPVTEKTLFCIASCTKAFTATALGILVDEGRLEWDRPVGDVLPEFRLKDSFASERMTTRDLLTHRCGLPRHDWVWVNSTATRAEMLERLRHLEPSKDFRTTYQYNNLMYMVAGMLVERITEKTWEDFIRERIFEPLGMTDSTFISETMRGTEGQTSNGCPVSLGHTERRRRIIPWHRSGETIRDAYTCEGPIGPAGSIYSNAVDMCRWVILQLNHGKVGRKTVISERNLKEIHTPHMVYQSDLVEKELLDPAYALGWSVIPYRGFRMLNHFGCLAGFRAVTSFMPSESLGVVVLSNNEGASSHAIAAIRLHVYDRLLGLERVRWNARLKVYAKKERAEATAKKREAARKRKRGTKPSHRLRDYAGTYRHPGYGELSVQLERRRLKLVYNQLSLRLRHYHYDVFQLETPGGSEVKEVSFGHNPEDAIASVAVQFEPLVEATVFARDTAAPARGKSANRDS